MLLTKPENENNLSISPEKHTFILYFINNFLMVDYLFKQAKD